MKLEINLYLDSLESYFSQFKEILDEVGTDMVLLNWRPVADGASSIFATIAFAALNVDYWIGHVMGGRAEPPGYDSVLEEARSDDPLILPQLLDSALETSRQIVQNFKAKDLDQTFDFADEFYSARACILQALQDTAMYYGKVETLLKWAKEARETQA